MARRPSVIAGVYFSSQRPHMPPKTKAELREMLTEAVRNTQPQPKLPKAK